MAKVEGHVEDRFKKVGTLLQKFIDDKEELGASIVVNIDGKDVIDLWGGYADKDRTRNWEKDTITNVWSTSKTAISLAALVCIDRGLLDPYEKVAKYWPGFAANGKENIEVRHLLSHSSGLSGWAKPVTTESICDLEATTKLLEQQAPWWTPGTASGYHSQTMGFLVGGLISRVTGKSLKQFIADDLATPLGADFQFGAKESDLARVSDIIPPPPYAPEDIPAALKDPTSLGFRTLTNPVTDANIANSAVWRDAEIGAANGHSNARGVARLLSTITLGGTASHSTLDRPLLSPSTIDLIFSEQTNGNDLVIGKHIRYGIGYGLTGRGTWMDWLPEGRICLWGGWGGSIVVMDLDRRMTIAYVMNKMENAGMGNERTKALVGEIYRTLGVEAGNA